MTAALGAMRIAAVRDRVRTRLARLSTSVHDRMCRLAISYQDAEAERGIVTLRAPLPDMPPALRGRLVADAVAVTRATREHEDIRQGSSVRGAIDLTYSTASPALQKLNADLDGKLAAPLDVVVLEPVPGGDPAKGQL